MSLDLGLAARVVAGIRSTTPGAVPWDTAGVAAALKAVGGSPGAALAAAALAAEDAKLEKPSEAGFRNHWPKNATSEPVMSHNVRCHEHPINFHPCPLCAAKRTPPPIDDPEYVAMKAALKGRQAPTTVDQRHQPTPTEELARARARADREANR
jgi:hypothetical protein